MFLLLFTYVFGSAISGSTGDYLQFALPGLLVQNALFYTLSTAIGLNTDITKGVFDRLRSLPIARTAPLSGRIIADTVKQVWAFALLVGFGMILGFRVTTSVAGLLGALALLTVVVLAMSCMSVLIGLKAASPEKVQMFSFSILMPLTFTSSSLVPSATFPSWLKAWSDINPVSYLADAIRGLLIGGDVTRAVSVSLLWSVRFVLAFAPLAIRAFRNHS